MRFDNVHNGLKDNRPVSWKLKHVLDTKTKEALFLSYTKTLYNIVLNEEKKHPIEVGKAWKHFWKTLKKNNSELMCAYLTSNHRCYIASLSIFCCNQREGLETDNDPLYPSGVMYETGEIVHYMPARFSMSFKFIKSKCEDEMGMTF